MTIVDAAELRVKWEQPGCPLHPCAHLKLEMVWFGSGTLQYDYCCSVCGHPVHH